MTDVFISYSRRDKDFVRRLHQALLDQKRDAWVDWEDIPPTADWRAEIRGGIDTSNAVIFIISPDSVRSKECRIELELALENNKRFIPVMRRMVTDAADQQAMHPALNSHNWIYLRDEDDFNAGFQTVVKALDTDLAYVREHTRLLVRAREWAAEKRDNSLLLRGKDLTEAEAWLAGGLQTKPPPTALHSEYIAASRQAETARGRRLLVGVSVALVVSALLAVLAFGQWQQAASNLALANTRGTEVAFQAATSDSNAVLAQNNAATADANAIRAQNSESTAVYQGGVAQAVALAARSQLNVDNNDPERAVLLAIEALKQYPYTAQAEYALSLAVQNVIPSRVFPGSTTFQANAFWSPDGQRLAIVNDSSSGIDVWDMDTGEKVTSITEEGKVIIKAAWSPDGTRLAAGGDDGTTTVWDPNWQKQFQIGGIGALWSPDGSRMVTFWDEFFVWDAQTGDLLYNMGSAGGYFALYQPMAWSPDGTRLATGDTDGTVTIWNAEDGTLDLELYGDEDAELYGHEDIVNVISWSPDGKRLISGAGDFADLSAATYASVYVWDAETGEAIWELNDGNYDIAVVSAAWSPDGRYMYSGSLEFVDVWDAETAENVFYLSGFNPQWSPDSAQILTGNLASNQASIYDASTSLQNSVLSSHSASVFSAAWSPDGRRVATASLDGTVRVWRFDTVAILSLEDDTYLSPLWSANGERLWVNKLFENTIQQWDVESGTPLLDAPQNAVSAAPTGDPRYVALDEETYELTVVDGDNRAIASFDGHTSPVFRVIWSPDAKEIASGGADNILFVWDAQTGEERFQLPGKAGIWSPDGEHLLVVSVDDTPEGFGKNTVTIYDARTGEAQITLPVAAQPNGETFVSAAAWSPDGTMVATSTEQGIGEGSLIEIWDTATWERLYTLGGVAFSWSPDGQRIASTQPDGTVNIQTLAGDLVYSIVDPEETLDEVAWSPNGRYLATGDKRLNIKVWRVATSTQDLLDYAQECCVLRDLTDEERQQYGLQPAS